MSSNLIRITRIKMKVAPLSFTPWKRYDWTVFFLCYFFACAIEQMDRVNRHKSKFQALEALDFVCTKKT